MEQQQQDFNKEKMNLPGMQPGHQMMKRQEQQMGKGSGSSLIKSLWKWPKNFMSTTVLCMYKMSEQSPVVSLPEVKKLQEFLSILRSILQRYNKLLSQIKGHDSTVLLHHLFAGHIEQTIDHIAKIEARISRWGILPEPVHGVWHRASCTRQEDERCSTLPGLLAWILEQEEALQKNSAELIMCSRDQQNLATAELLEGILSGRKKIVADLTYVLSDNRLLSACIRYT